ncbi:MAG TPA: hypothetical protein DD614_04530 [Clostridiales bacterium]|nr:hypothetical protein [Clostridiales bacterium]
MSLFFVDSASDLSVIDAKKLGIEMINLPYLKEGDRIEFDKNFDFVKFYSKHKKGIDISRLPLSEKEYTKIFEPCLKQGDDVVYVCSSENIIEQKNLTDCVNALTQKYTERTFKLIDSKSISIGQGLVSYACAMLYRHGDDVETIYNKSFDIRNEYAMYFSCDSMEKLFENSIILNTQSVGTSLNIKPIMAINLDGNAEIIDKVSGKKKAISKMLELLRQTGENVADYPIGVVYSNDEASALELCEKIKEYYGQDVQIICNRMTPSNVGVLGGGMLGISFHVHRKIH